jgi:hypothetical protein
MMAWQDMVLLGAIVGAFLFGMYREKVTWRTSLWFIGAVVALAWADGRYAVEAPDERDRAVIVDTWTGRKVGLLFDASRDNPEEPDRDLR